MEEKRKVKNKVISVEHGVCIFFYWLNGSEEERKGKGEVLYFY